MKNKKVVILFLAALAVCAFIFIIFVPKSSVTSSSPQITYEEYLEKIKVLNDTIQELKGDVAKFEAEMVLLKGQREVLEQQIEIILKEYEKKDSAIANGDWEYNIRFLSDYLSEIDLGPDTLLAITRQQLIDINRTINKAIHLEETNKILQMDLAISDSLSYFQNSIIEKQDSIIAITDKKYMETTALSDDLQKQITNNKKRYRRNLYKVGVGATLLGVVLGVIFK